MKTLELNDKQRADLLILIKQLCNDKYQKISLTGSILIFEKIENSTKNYFNGSISRLKKYGIAREETIGLLDFIVFTLPKLMTELQSKGSAPGQNINIEQFHAAAIMNKFVEYSSGDATAIQGMVDYVAKFVKEQLTPDDNTTIELVKASVDQIVHYWVGLVLFPKKGEVQHGDTTIEYTERKQV